MFRRNGPLGLILITLSLLVTLVATLPVLGQGQIPDPPPAPLCFDMNFDARGVVRAEPGDMRYDVNCRLINANGAYLSWYGRALTAPANVGQRPLIDLGVIGAVDVFSGSGLTQFTNAVTICLRGSGPLWFAAADEAPRAAIQMSVFGVSGWSGFRCTTIFEPGLLVMTRVPAGATTEPLNTILDVRDCHGTTTDALRLRSGPNTSSDTLTVIPFGEYLEIDQKTGHWYRVRHPEGINGGYGWVSGRYLRLEGTCV